MLLVSSVGSIGSRTFQSAHRQSSEEDGGSVVASPDDASVYEDSHEDLSGTSDLFLEEDGESYGGTIIASLSSKEVSRNLLETGLFCRSSEPLLEAATRKPHPLSRTHKTLSEIATVQSEPLSFTPTMAEQGFSGQSKTQEAPKSIASGGSEAMSTFGITNIQPEQVACPFCDHEKDLQWCLSKERKEHRDLKLSEYKTRFLLFALVVSIISFFLGKTVSDMQSEKVMAQYMRQCNELVHQKDDEDLYWKLVTAAFSAMINGIAGPLANFVLSSATQPK